MFHQTDQSTIAQHATKMCHVCHTLHHHHMFFHPTYRTLSAYHVLGAEKNKLQKKERKALATLRHVRETHREKN